VKKIILEGQSRMKPQTVSEKQADDVVEFLRILK